MFLEDITILFRCLLGLYILQIMCKVSRIGQSENTLNTDPTQSILLTAALIVRGRAKDWLPCPIEYRFPLLNSPLSDSEKIAVLSSKWRNTLSVKILTIMRVAVLVPI